MGELGVEFGSSKTVVKPGGAIKGQITWTPKARSYPRGGFLIASKIFLFSHPLAADSNIQRFTEFSEANTSSGAKY